MQAATQLRRLDDRDRGAIEAHLLDLDPVSRNRRFRAGFGDAAISAYVSRLDLRSGIVFGAIEPDSGRIVGLAEAYAAGAPGTVEIGATVIPERRRCGLAGALVRRAVAASVAQGADTVELLFDPGNYPAARIAAGLNARFGSPGRAVLHIAPSGSAALAPPRLNFGPEPLSCADGAPGNVHVRHTRPRPHVLLSSARTGKDHHPLGHA